MINWEETMILYHGSYCSVPAPRLENCRPYKDFGLGFYLATSINQAKNFVPSAIRKAIRLGLVPNETDFGFVSIYRFCKPSQARIQEYAQADADWLHCIAAHRKEGTFVSVKQDLQACDIIAGKIANDQTNATLTAYLAQLYGEPGTKEADDYCISRLLPEKLENQICLLTQTALSGLKFIGEEKICLNKH